MARALLMQIGLSCFRGNFLRRGVAGGKPPQNYVPGRHGSLVEQFLKIGKALSPGLGKLGICLEAPHIGAKHLVLIPEFRALPGKNGAKRRHTRKKNQQRDKVAHPHVIAVAGSLVPHKDNAQLLTITHQGIASLAC